MTTATPAMGGRTDWRSSDSWRRLFREKPVIPLIVLLVALIVVLQVVQPGTVGPTWAAAQIRFAVPLAILAACQTLTMLTGGIDLSVGMIASMAAYIMATQVPTQGPLVAILIALVVCGVAGLANGIGVGIFRVHPLIMTLAMSLVILGLMTVYQLIMVSSGAKVPAEVAWLGGGSTQIGDTGILIPNSLLLFIPLAGAILYGLKRSGFGRLLYAIGDNERAARLSGVRVWQVLVALYILSAVLAGIAGLVYVGVTKVATVTLVEKQVLTSVAAAVIGGTSIFGGRGGYAGTILGALILTVLTSLLTVLQMPEAARQILFGAIVLAVAAAYTRITAES
jgi:ribose transport system permease protein